MNLAGFKSLFDQYYEPIRNLIYYKLGDIDLAEDLTQEVFMKAWEKRTVIVMESAKSYLYTIASNLTINHFKSARHRYEFAFNKNDKSSNESPQYIIEEKEFTEQLKKAIADLPEIQRVVFLMNRIDDLTYKEIAERLGISAKAVEKRMHNALSSLRSIIQYKF